MLVPVLEPGVAPTVTALLFLRSHVARLLHERLELRHRNRVHCAVEAVEVVLCLL